MDISIIEIQSIFRMNGFVKKGNPPVIALKGAEAAGFVSRETTGILYATLRKMMAPQAKKPGFMIWGGVATPEAAAAFLCSGASGIVFESLHWQTDLVSANPNLKRRLPGLRPEHTAVVGHNLGVPCRFFDKGNSLAVKELKQSVTRPQNVITRLVRVIQNHGKKSEKENPHWKDLYMELVSGFPE